MKSNIITGIDLGSDKIKIVVADATNIMKPVVLGVGIAQTEGISKGYIVDLDKVTHSIQKALDDAVRNARLRPQGAYISIGGISLQGTISKGSTHIRTSDSIITDYDIERASLNANKIIEKKLQNHRIIHEIPISHSIDGETALCDPIGLRATKLESEILFIHALDAHINDFVTAVENAGVEVIDVTAGPLASSFASMNTPQKMQGSILLDIGSESTGMVIFEKNVPIYISILPHGSADITNALAVIHKISIQDAEQLKKSNLIGADINIKKTQKTITNSVEEMLNTVKQIITNSKTGLMLPGGVLLTGGGSKLEEIQDIVKTKLKLPVKIAYPSDKKIENNPELSIAYGLCIWGGNNFNTNSILSKIKLSLYKILKWFKKFLP